MTHVGVNGNHSFLNVDDMYEGWNQILLEDHSFNLKARRLENNQTQISTVGSMPISSITEILMMSRNEVPSFPRARHSRRQNRIYKEQELVMNHQWLTVFLPHLKLACRMRPMVLPVSLLMLRRDHTFSARQSIVPQA
jgi:hypothetical protein